MALFDTAANIISDAAVELGLGAIATPYASTDANVVQLRGLLKREGRKLALMREWTELRREYTFATVGGTASYDLPLDFGSMLDGSGWNRTTRLPIAPLSGQQWEAAQAQTVVGTLTLLFLPKKGALEVYPTPSAAETIAVMYRSRWWIIGDGETELSADAPTADADTVLFDSMLMVAALKLAWLKAKGFDTTSAQQDFDEAFALAASANVNAAPTLSLSGCRGEPLLSDANAPDTGYGQ